MKKETKENTGRYLRELSADAGCFSETNLQWLKGKIDAYIPGGRNKHNEKPEPAPKDRIPVDLPLLERMRRKLWS
jgi:hypothetical protein